MDHSLRLRFFKKSSIGCGETMMVVSTGNILLSSYTYCYIKAIKVRYQSFSILKNFSFVRMFRMMYVD